MIALGANCLLFKTLAGESVPLTPDMISIELTGEAEQMFEPDFVDNAASAVFHYFKHEVGRETVTVAEFAEALEKALKSLGGGEMPSPAKTRRLVESDLRKLAGESGCELVFFATLRAELRKMIKDEPEIVSFSWLQDCVKDLAGARRWTPRCRTLKSQILSYLEGCLCAEHTRNRLSLVVR